MATGSPSYVQEFEMGGHWYRLVIDHGRHPEWKSIVLRDGEPIHEDDYCSEKQAKRMAHFVAFADSGNHQHDCDDVCESSWLRTA